MVIVGVLLLVVGGILFFVRQHQQARSFSLKSARQVTVAELQSTAAAIANEMGGGSWRDYVKLWGKAEANPPLISELKQQPCVYYSYSVEREYEETVQEKDAEGRTRTETRRCSETLSSHRQSTPFYLNDGSGEVLVDPDGASLETVEVANDFHPGEPGGGLLSYGKFSLTLGNVPFGNRRTLGYRYRESILPVERSMLVVGTVSDQNGTLTLAKPLKSDQHFIIALKPDDALALSADTNSQRAFYGMVFCLIGGILLILLGLIS